MGAQDCHSSALSSLSIDLHALAQVCLLIHSLMSFHESLFSLSSITSITKSLKSINSVMEFMYLFAECISFMLSKISTKWTREHEVKVLYFMSPMFLVVYCSVIQGAGFV